MARRSQVFTQLPWTGGLNLSVDAGVIPANDLTVADNVIFSESTARIRRNGYEYLDAESAIPDVLARSSSTTTRTLVFPEDLSTATNEIFVVGEKITVANNGADFNGNFIVASITTTTPSDQTFGDADVTVASDQIEITSHGFYTGMLCQLTTTGTLPAGLALTTDYYAIVVDANTIKLATTLANALSGTAVDITAAAGGGTHTVDVTAVANNSITYTSTSATVALEDASGSVDDVSRNWTFIGLHDYWYDNAGTQEQVLVGVSDEPKIYKYDSNGSRLEITKKDRTDDTFADGDVTTGTDTVNITGHGFYTGMECVLTTTGTLPTGLSTGTTYYVIRVDDDNIKFATTIGNARNDIVVDITAAVGGGTHTVDVTNPTALSSPSEANFAVINNKLIIAFDGTANTPKTFDGADTDEWDDLKGNPPNFSVSRVHLGRLFTNDKSRRDRLHYSSPGGHEEWQGVGDSAAIDMFPEDGDPIGITAILPPFKGRLFIGKKAKFMELLGNAPENFDPNVVSDGIGVESHRASVAVDFNDVYFMSDRGIHSTIATDTEGGFQSNFLSNKIQKEFNTFQESKLATAQAAYIPQLNSVAYAIANTTTARDEVWLYNVIQGEWYRWPSVSCEALSRRLDTDATYKVVFGTNDGRIIQAQSSSKQDFISTNVTYTIKTGQIYPDNNPYTLKLFKSVALYFKPKGEIDITLNVEIDNLGAQTRTINPNQGVTNLGNDFILGTSVLGGSGALAPFTVPVDGKGRSITLEIVTSGGNQDIELYGYSIEYEMADITQETV